MTALDRTTSSVARVVFHVDTAACIILFLRWLIWAIVVRAYPRTCGILIPIWISLGPPAKARGPALLSGRDCPL